LEEEEFDRVGSPSQFQAAIGQGAIFDLGAGVIEDTGAGFVQTPPPGRSIKLGASDKVERLGVDRNLIAGRLGPRPVNFGLIIAGGKCFAGPNPHPLKPVAEEGDRVGGLQAGGLGAKRLPIGGKGKAALVLPSDQNRAT
jgi:hypothetical protein